MSEPPQFPPNPDEPRNEPPAANQYPPSGSWLGESPPPQQPPQQQPQYAPPPPFGQPGPYGGPGPNPYGPGFGEQYPGGQPAPAPRIRVGELVAARSRQRPEPRTTITFAGVGALLVVLGGLVWSIGYFQDGFDASVSGPDGPMFSGEGRRFLGAGVFAVATVLGYLLVIRGRRGPLATAGTVLAATGVPLALAFVTLSLEDVYRNGDYPFDLDLVYVLSIIIWLATYLFVPGARGRSLFLGAAALGFSNYVALKAAGTDSLRAAAQTGPTGLLGSTGSDIAAAGIIIGLIYYGIALFLDRRGRHGAATPLVLAGYFTTLGGVIAGIPDFELAGTGVVLLVLGLALCMYGGWAGRRFTTWAWAGAIFVGIFLIVVDIIGQDSDDYTAFGITFIVIGAGLAAIGQVLHSALDERPDIDETPPLPPNAQPMPYGGPRHH